MSERKLYVVVIIDPCGYDSWDCSYHLTKKGAHKYIINRNYDNWIRYGYITPGSYDELSMYIREQELYD